MRGQSLVATLAVPFFISGFAAVVWGLKCPGEEKKKNEREGFVEESKWKREQRKCDLLRKMVTVKCFFMEMETHFLRENSLSNH